MGQTTASQSDPNNIKADDRHNTKPSEKTMNDFETTDKTDTQPNNTKHIQQSRHSDIEQNDVSSLCITVGDFVALKDGRNGRILFIGPKSATDDTIVYGIDTTQSIATYCKFKNNKEFEEKSRDGGIQYKQPYYSGFKVQLDEIKQHYVEPKLTSKDLAEIDKYCKWDWYKDRFIQNYACNLARISIGDQVIFPYKNWRKGVIKYIGPYSKYHTSEYDGSQKYAPNGGPEIYFGVELFQLSGDDPKIYTIPKRRHKDIFYFKYANNALFCKSDAFQVLTKKDKTMKTHNNSYVEVQEFLFTLTVSSIFFECITIIDYYNLIQCKEILNLNQWNELIFPQKLRYKKYIESMSDRKNIFDQYFERNERRIQSNRFEVVTIKIECNDESETSQYNSSRYKILQSIITKFCCELFSCYRYDEKDLKNIVMSLCDAKEYLDGDIKKIKNVTDSEFSYNSRNDVKPSNKAEKGSEFEEIMYYRMHREPTISCNIFECGVDEFNFNNVHSIRFGSYRAFNGNSFSVFDELKNILILPKVIDIQKWYIGNASYDSMSSRDYNICMGLLKQDNSYDLTRNEIKETFVLWCMMSSIWES